MRPDLCDESNYRGISLANCITKITDWIILKQCSKELASTDLQFAFKPKHSTSMCSYIVKETATYYMNKGSEVFICMLDASKAFDRIHHGKLFEILIKRKVPYLIIRLLMDMYQKQYLRTVWNGLCSPYFGCTNGVKQGGVLSQVLFTVYLDELLMKLKTCGLGCHVGNEYVVVVSYACDITLMCPNRNGLQTMIYMSLARIIIFSSMHQNLCVCVSPGATKNSL